MIYLLLFSSYSFDWSLIQTINHPYNSTYGNSVSYCSKKNIVFVGAPDYKTNGAVFIYQYDGRSQQWEEKQIITPLGIYNGHFGETLASSDDCNRLFVGAPETALYSGEKHGVVIFYQYSNGKFEKNQILQAPFTIESDFLGRHISISPSGNRIAVSLSEKVYFPQSDSRPGSVLIYDFSTIWRESSVLNISFSTKNSYFGFDTKFSDEKTLFVTVTSNALDQMPSRVYHLDEDNKWIIADYLPIPVSSSTITWTSLRVSKPMDRNDRVGVIGFDSDHKRGTIFLYNNNGNGWKYDSKIEHSSVTSFYEFNYIDENTIIIPDKSNNDKGKNVGALYIYKKTQGVFQHIETIYPPDNTEFLTFGSSLFSSPSQSVLVVGAHSKDHSHNLSLINPKVYVYVNKFASMPANSHKSLVVLITTLIALIPIPIVVYIKMKNQ